MLVNDRFDWYKARALMGDKRRYAYSDMGCLRIGNVYISHGNGDEGCRYAVIDDENLYVMSNKMMRLDIPEKCTIDGTNAIYNYDCADVPSDVVLEGKYTIYAREGLVFIVKW